MNDITYDSLSQEDNSLTTSTERAERAECVDDIETHDPYEPIYNNQKYYLVKLHIEYPEILIQICKHYQIKFKCKECALSEYWDEFKINLCKY